MSFEALIDKVKQAEAALEATERQAGADWRQLKASWRQLWTPGRLVLTGLGSGFLVGLVEPGKRMASGRGTLQMLSAVAGLFAGGSAQVAAGKASDAADQAAQTTAVAEPVARDTLARSAAADGSNPEALRRAGLL